MNVIETTNTTIVKDERDETVRYASIQDGDEVEMSQEENEALAAIDSEIEESNNFFDSEKLKKHAQELDKQFSLGNISSQEEYEDKLARLAMQDMIPKLNDIYNNKLEHAKLVKGMTAGTSFDIYESFSFDALCSAFVRHDLAKWHNNPDFDKHFNEVYQKFNKIMRRSDKKFPPLNSLKIIECVGKETSSRLFRYFVMSIWEVVRDYSWVKTEQFVRSVFANMKYMATIIKYVNADEASEDDFVAFKFLYDSCIHFNSVVLDAIQEKVVANPS